MRAFNANTAYYILLGNPVAHSLSPLIHNAGFQALGLNAVYLAAPVEAADLSAAIQGLKALAVSGCNVTSPYKEAVIPYLDHVTEEAKIISSVNTIVNKEGVLFGTSTDGEGFYHSLLEGDPNYDLKRPALLIGAGGSARAVAYTLAQKGLQELWLANRSLDNAEELAGMIKKYSPLKNCRILSLKVADLKEALAYCRLIVYCLPLDAEEVKMMLSLKDVDMREKLFYDLRYSPAETEVMKSAAQAGAKTFNGMGLLFRQALLAFELFTDRAAPEEQMRLALKCYLEKEKQDDSI